MKEELTRLRRALEESEATVTALVAGQVDAVAGAHGPLLLSKAQAALQSSEERFRALIENGSDVITLLDSKGRIVYATPSLQRALSWRPADSLGRELLEFIHPEDRPQLSELLTEARVVPGCAVRRELRAQTRDGMTRVLDMVVTNRLDDPMLGVIVCNATDVTAQKELHAHLMVADRMASLGTLAAGVAHEINNPLAALIGNLQLLADDLTRSRKALSSLSGDMAMLVAEAQEAAERVRLIARDLKLFSRSEERDRGPVDLQRLLESSLRMSRNELRHRARVVKEYEPVPLVYANEARLGQVFVNLLVNAAQAIPEGRADENEIRVSLRGDGYGHVVVEISDTGAGISPEILPRVFDPFFTTKPAEIGTGLGLAICQRIVSELGGAITVESRPGEGATFTVVLPVEPVADGLAARAGLAEVPASRRGDVLVIDDEPLVRSYVSRTLSESHNVIADASAEIALARIRRGKRFDAIICDVMMPQMTGIDFFEELNQIAPEQSPRVIFITGGTFTTRTRRFLEKTKNPRVEKPFEPIHLRTVVNQLVG